MNRQISITLYFVLILYSLFTPAVSAEKSSANSEDITIIDNPFVLMIEGPKMIYKEMTPNSKMLGMANRGKYFPLISKGQSWCKIEYNGQVGFIQNRYVEVVAKKSSELLIKDMLKVVIPVLLIIILIIILKFVLGRDSVKSEWFSTTHIPKKILLISKDTTTVTRYLTNETTSLESCFTELGFALKKADNSQAATKLIFSFMPDAIAVDWNIGQNSQAIMEQILTSKSTVNNIFVLFYNVPESFDAKKNSKIPNSQFLSISFSDKDLFNIITPLIITGEKSHNITKSVEASALQGPVQSGSLLDVLQFIEIGKKTGCLLVEEQKPTGIVYFNNGIINYAVSRHNRAEKAIYDILNLDTGRFSFVLDRQPKTPNCSIPILSVLMQWAKENDEASGDRLR